MIEIQKSPVADTRTCDFTKVTKEQLYYASKQHILDVRKALRFFIERLEEAKDIHDYTKLTQIDQFHADFITGFKQTSWWDNHRRQERHHLNNPDGVREDVNLIDVLEYIADCVMAGKGRSGTVYDIKIDSDVLMRAFDNTWQLLEKSVVVTEAK